MHQSFPQIARVRQHLTTDRVDDIAAEVQDQLDDLSLADLVKPEMRVAVGVGSRGIACIRDVVAPLIERLLALGTRPYLVPAMGSHGGGNAEGQRDVLIGYGLGDLGVPIQSSMETRQIGITDQGMPVYTDVNAAQADAIIVVNRIKPHTSFRANWESGLTKMLAVGLGKAEGAATLHAWGIAEAIPAAAAVIIDKLPVVAGIGIVENGHHQPAQIRALRGDAIMQEEPSLLQAAWRHLPRIPLEPLDLLVIQEIGKDISGTGMDLNVVGMWRRNGGPIAPNYRVVTALDLTPNSHGNGVGVGYCDLVPQRLIDKIDFGATYTNCLTASNFNGAKVPITLPTDRAVIEAGLPRTDPTAARMVIARNTLDLGEFWVSAALLDDVAAEPLLEQTGPLQGLSFDESGALSLPEPAHHPTAA